MTGDFGKALAVWNSLVPECDLAAHQGRILAQKSLYIVQEMGVSCGYSFEWTIRGVYSPDLNRDIFAALAAVSKQEKP